MAEIRHLLWQLVWQWLPQAGYLLTWSNWRRRHQATAMHFHYQRRLALADP